jgi:hypothetical protein
VGIDDFHIVGIAHFDWRVMRLSVALYIGSLDFEYGFWLILLIVR